MTGGGTHKIAFEINFQKTLEAILYVLSKRKAVNMYNVLKIMFSADKFHLNKYGRPVTGDTYIKMNYGTVPSLVLDICKHDPLALAALNLESYPFAKETHHLSALRGPALEYLSETDLQALDHGIAEYIELDFNQVREKNHLERCWQEGEINQPISFESMIDDPEVLAELKNSTLRRVV